MALHLNNTLIRQCMEGGLAQKSSLAARALCLTLQRCSEGKKKKKTSLNPSPLHHARQNHKKFPLLIKWAPQTRSHKALTYKELTPAKKTPASLTGMKGAENSKDLKRLHISWLYRQKPARTLPQTRPGAQTGEEVQFSLRKSSWMQVKAPPTSALRSIPQRQTLTRFLRVSATDDATSFQRC